MGDQAEMSSAITTPVKLGRLGNSDFRHQNKKTIYNVCKFFKDISQQPEYFSNINVHKTQKITGKVCDVHHSTVKEVCSKAFSSLSDKVYPSSRKAYKRKHHVPDINNFNKDVLCWKVYKFHGNILQHES
jgi:hypothetical protein